MVSLNTLAVFSGNHYGIFRSAGFSDIRYYKYWCKESLCLDLRGNKILKILAENKKVGYCFIRFFTQRFVFFQSCCPNFCSIILEYTILLVCWQYSRLRIFVKLAMIQYKLAICTLVILCNIDQSK